MDNCGLSSCRTANNKEQMTLPATEMSLLETGSQHGQMSMPAVGTTEE